MSHSAISATATMSYNFDLILGTQNTKIDFSGLVSNINRMFDRVLFISQNYFEVLLFVDPLAHSGNTMTDVDMLYIENLDTQNAVDICLARAGIGAVIHRIPAGKFIILFGRDYRISEVGCGASSHQWDEVHARFTTHEGILRIVAIEE